MRIQNSEKAKFCGFIYIIFLGGYINLEQPSSSEYIGPIQYVYLSTDIS